MAWNRHPKNQFGRRNVDMVADWWPESSFCFFRTDLHEFAMEPIPGCTYVKALNTEAKRCPESWCAQFKADGSGRDWRNLSPPQGIAIFLLLSRLYCYCWALKLIWLFPWVGQIFQQMWAMPTITYGEGDYRGKNIWEELTIQTKWHVRKESATGSSFICRGNRSSGPFRVSEAFSGTNVHLLSFRS